MVSFYGFKSHGAFPFSLFDFSSSGTVVGQVNDSLFGSRQIGLSDRLNDMNLDGSISSTTVCATLLEDEETKAGSR